MSSTTQAAAPGQFRIVEPRWRNPITGQTCTLADLPDGRRVARQTFPGNHGKAVHLYWLVSPDPDINPQPLNGLTDDLGVPHGALEQAQYQPRFRMFKMEPSPLEKEVAAFARQFPLVAEHLNLLRARPARRIDVGACWRPSTYDFAKAGEIDFEHYRDLIIGGDFGAHGKLDDVGPLDEATLFTIGLQESTPIKNAESARSGIGAVRSEYPIEGRKGVAVHAITALMPDPCRNFTVFSVVAPML